MAQSHEEFAAETERRFGTVANSWQGELSTAMREVRRAMGVFATTFAKAGLFQAKAATAGRTLNAAEPGAYENLVGTLVDADALRGEMQETLAGSFIGDGLVDQYAAHTDEVEALEEAAAAAEAAEAAQRGDGDASDDREDDEVS